MEAVFNIDTCSSTDVGVYSIISILNKVSTISWAGPICCYNPDKRQIEFRNKQFKGVGRLIDGIYVTNIDNHQEMVNFYDWLRNLKHNYMKLTDEDYDKLINYLKDENYVRNNFREVYSFIFNLSTRLYYKGTFGFIFYKDKTLYNAIWEALDIRFANEPNVTKEMVIEYINVIFRACLYFVQIVLPCWKEYDPTICTTPEEFFQEERFYTLDSCKYQKLSKL